MIKPQAYHPMHPMGDSTMVDTSSSMTDLSGLVYIHVPKNASCWIKYHLGQLQSQPYNYYDNGFDTQKHLALVVLREPVQRWISAMAQIFIGYPPDYYLTIDWNNLTKTIFRNNHTQPQHEFFANIPHDRIVWFRCDRLLEHVFQQFLSTHGLVIDPLPTSQDIDNVFNITAKAPAKIINGYNAPPQQVIVDEIHRVLQAHPEYVQRLEQLYKVDYEFFNSVPYYGTK